MSTSVSFYVGFYLICHMQKITEETTVRRCPNGHQHMLTHDDRFCPKCGAAITDISTLKPKFISVRDVVDRQSNWAEKIGTQPGSITVAQLVKDITPFYNEHISWTLADDVEILGYKMFGIAEASAGAVVELGEEERPSEELIADLTAFVGYTKVEVKRGVIVEYS